MILAHRFGLRRSWLLWEHHESHAAFGSARPRGFTIFRFPRECRQLFPHAGRTFDRPIPTADGNRSRLENAKGLPQTEITIAERLREARHQQDCLANGIWGIRQNDFRGTGSTFVGHSHGATHYISHVTNMAEKTLWRNDQPIEETGYSTTLITQHSLQFIEDHQNKPFFLFVSHSAIHFRWMLPEDSPHRKAGQRHEDAKGKLGPHIGLPIQPVVQRMVEELDQSVGEIVKCLKRLQLNEKTLIFFTSDNGESCV